jgi:O-antigen/teichoic acid export membrane protein
MSSPDGVRLVRNTAINGLGSATAIVIGLLLTPFLIHRLGLEAYGVWALALALTFAGGYASLSELGVEGATIRYVAESCADNDLPALNRTVCTSLAVFCVAAVLLAGAVVALAHALVALFGVPAHLRDAAAACFALAGAQLAFELPARTFVAVLAGTQSFFAYQAVELGRALLQAALFVFVVLQGWGIAGLGAALAASSLATLIAYWIVARRAVAGLRASPFRASRAELSRLLRFGGGMFASRLLSTVYNQIDRTVVGVALGPRPVGWYEIANRVYLGAGAVGSVCASAVLPAAASLRREAALLRDMFLRGSCYAAAVSLPVAVATFVFARPLLLSWIGPSALPAVGAVRLFMGYAALQAVNDVPSTMLYGLGRIRFPLLVNASATALNLALSIALVHPLGFSGVVVATLLANGLAWPLLVWYYASVFECSLATWLRRVIAPNLPGLLAQVCVSLALYATIGARTRSFVLAVALIGLSIGSSLLAFVLIGVRGRERRALLDTLRRALGRSAPELAM